MNYSFRKKNKTVKYIVLHYTGMEDFKSAYSRLNDPLSDVSAHYLIQKSGKIYNLICPRMKAWHAGKSQWKNEKSLNDISIGIELENKGHDYRYKKFTNKQYFSLGKLINSLKNRYAIIDENIIFHSDIAPNRKKDPGEKFDLSKINILRFNNLIIHKKTPIKNMMKIYGFSEDYIKIYYYDCIMAVKRSLKYKKIDRIIDKKFKKDFYNLLINKY